MAVYAYLALRPEPTIQVYVRAIGNFTTMALHCFVNLVIILVTTALTPLNALSVQVVISDNTTQLLNTALVLLGITSKIRNSFVLSVSLHVRPVPTALTVRHARLISIKPSMLLLEATTVYV